MVGGPLVNLSRDNDLVSCGRQGNLLPCRQYARGDKLSTPHELDQFLSSVERRAYKHALFAVRDPHIALDIVQDAMLKLAEKYGDKPAEELPMLFQRILQNTIRDQFRRQKVRSAWFTLFSGMQSNRDDTEYDPLDVLIDDENQSAPVAPDANMQQKQIMDIIENALGDLPSRQREAFLLRYWEGLDTIETAGAMGCSEGSVKTHCSRASHALAAALKLKGIELP